MAKWNKNLAKFHVGSLKSSEGLKVFYSSILPYESKAKTSLNTEEYEEIIEHLEHQKLEYEVIKYDVNDNILPRTITETFNSMTCKKEQKTTKTKGKAKSSEKLEIQFNSLMRYIMYQQLSEKRIKTQKNIDIFYLFLNH